MEARDTEKAIGNKFTTSEWTTDNKVQPNGRNTLIALRRFRNQLKSQALSGKAAGLENYPCLLYTSPSPRD